jgi:glucokinase
MDSMNVLALDLGGTKLAAALFDSDGGVLQRATFPIAGRAGADVGAAILRAIANLTADARPAAVGVAVPGIYRSGTGTVWAPNIPGWDDYPLLAELTAALGNVPVAIESDRTCYILGEVWRGNARGARNAVFLAVGTGIGAGILIDGRVVRGHQDIAGAIGWLALDRPYQDQYQSCGCFEYYAAGPGIARAAQQRGLDGATTESVFEASDAGDERAQGVIAQAVAYWGMAVANLVSLLNPEVIVFGGGVFGPAASMLDGIYNEALKWAQPISIRHVKLVTSALGSDAGIYGAAQSALAIVRGTDQAISA